MSCSVAKRRRAERHHHVLQGLQRGILERFTASRVPERGSRASAGRTKLTPAGTLSRFEESAQLCVLASVAGRINTSFVPKLNPDEHLILLEEMARGFL